MSRQETVLRHQHRGDPAGFLAWVCRATRGEFSINYTGNLAADRITMPEVEELASLVLLLADTKWVNPIQCRKSVAHPMDYMAIRTGEGFLPRSIATNAISAADYRVLSGVHEYSLTPNAKSMLRAIRAMMPTCSEDAAHALHRRFPTEGWIEPKEGNRKGHGANEITQRSGKAEVTPYGCSYG